MEERRSVARWRLDQEASLILDNGAMPISCVVEDLSTNGMRLSMGKNVFPELFSSFSLALGTDFSLKLGANVAWHDAADTKNIYGLSFNEVNDTLKEAIVQYVKDHFPSEMAKHWWKGA